MGIKKSFIFKLYTLISIIFLSSNVTFAQLSNNVSLNNDNNVSVVLDFSNSINDELNSLTKEQIIKNNLPDKLNNLNSLNLQVKVFGTNYDSSATAKPLSCELIETIIDFDQPTLELEPTLNILEPLGWTPLTLAITESLDSLINKDGDKTMILVIDGEDNCGLDPSIALNSYDQSELSKVQFEFITLDANRGTQAFIESLENKINLNQYNVKNEDEFKQSLDIIVETINVKNSIKQVSFSSTPETAIEFSSENLDTVFRLQEPNANSYTYFNLAKDDILQINVRNPNDIENVITKVTTLDEQLEELDTDTVLGQGQQRSINILIQEPGKYYVKIANSNIQALNQTYFNFAITKNETTLPIINDDEFSVLALLDQVGTRNVILVAIALLILSIVLFSFTFKKPKIATIDTTNKAANFKKEPLHHPKMGTNTIYSNNSNVDYQEQNYKKINSEFGSKSRASYTNKGDAFASRSNNNVNVKWDDKLKSPNSEVANLVTPPAGVVTEDNISPSVNSIIVNESDNRPVQFDPIMYTNEKVIKTSKGSIKRNRAFEDIESNNLSTKTNNNEIYKSGREININNADSPAINIDNGHKVYTLPKVINDTDSQLKVRGRRNSFLYKDNFNSINIKPESKPSLTNNHIKQKFQSLGIIDPEKSELAETSNNLSLNGSVKYMLSYLVRQDYNDIFHYYKITLQSQGWVYIGAHDLSSYQKSLVFRKERHDLDILIENTFFKIAANTVKLYLREPSNYEKK